MTKCHRVFGGCCRTCPLKELQQQHVNLRERARTVRPYDVCDPLAASDPVTDIIPTLDDKTDVVVEEMKSVPAAMHTASTGASTNLSTFLA